MIFERTRKLILYFFIVALIILLYKMRITTEGEEKPEMFKGTARKKGFESSSDILGDSFCGSSSSNNHCPGHPDMIFFTRVPKAGGTSAMWILGNFSRESGLFHYYRSGKFTSVSCANNKCYHIANKLHQLQQCNNGVPIVYDKHQHFIDFRKIDLAQPMYFSIVRDPVQQAQSQYYFVRFRQYGYPFFNKNQKNLNMTFDECIVKGLPECVNSHTTLKWFCGASNSVCQSASVGALKEAKRNVEQHYNFIGLTEDSNNFWGAMEDLFPRYFSGLKEHLLQTGFSNQTTIMVTKKKPKMSKRATDIMSKILAYDIELYMFIKQRYHNTLQKLKLVENWNKQAKTEADSIVQKVPQGAVDDTERKKTDINMKLQDVSPDEKFNLAGHLLSSSVAQENKNTSTNQCLKPLHKELGLRVWNVTDRSVIHNNNRLVLTNEIYAQGLQCLVVDELLNL